MPNARYANQLIENVSAMIHQRLLDLCDLTGVRKLIRLERMVIFPTLQKFLQKSAIRDPH